MSTTNEFEIGVILMIASLTLAVVMIAMTRSAEQRRRRDQRDREDELRRI